MTNSILITWPTYPRIPRTPLQKSFSRRISKVKTYVMISIGTVAVTVNIMGSRQFVAVAVDTGTSTLKQKILSAG